MHYPRAFVDICRHECTDACHIHVCHPDILRVRENGFSSSCFTAIDQHGRNMGNLIVNIKCWHMSPTPFNFLTTEMSSIVGVTRADISVVALVITVCMHQHG